MSISECTRKALLELFDEDDKGYREMCIEECWDKFPEEDDPQYWKRPYLIIKGTVVVPEAVKYATRHVIE
jgi:hypothetical protein